MGHAPGTRREHGSLRRRRAATIAVALAFVAVTFAAPSAEAQTPGTNGRIVFERATEADGFDIWSMHGVKNGRGIQLTTDGNNDLPSWSPNGSEIAFGSDRTGVFQIFLMGAAGGNQRKISPSPNCADFPSFSPDGKRIVFAQWPDPTCTGAPDIWSMKRDGSDPKQLTHTPEQRDLFPKYSPDGTKIVFATHTSSPHTFALFTTNTNGSGRRRITARGLNATAPDWSPDGQKIVFQSGADEEESSLYLIDPDGTHLRRLTPRVPFVTNGLPAWSPDGKQILFTSNIDDQFDLYSYRMSNGKTRRRGTSTPDADEFISSWQPRP